VPPDSPAALHTPLFQDLVAGLDATGRHVILDLGAASTAMLALLGRSPCRVEIADLAHFGGIDQLNTAEPGPALTDAAEYLLPNRLPDDAIDLVFCWDLPNYLTLDALSALMGAIGRRARPGALAHALIFYAERDMKESPGRFVPTADGELIDRSAPGAAIAAPRYSPEDLGKSMGGFLIDRARLLSNGMQEFLFRLES
jgi:S-adenosylmethionine:diacylglycerol 3-amino-3-carboxypropyl transferase